MSIRELNNLLGLRGQFLLLVSAVVIGSSTIIGVYLTDKIERVSQEEVITRSKQLVSSLAYNSEFSVLVGADEDLEKLALGAFRDSLVVYVRMYDQDCNLLYEQVRDSYKALASELSPQNVGLQGLIPHCNSIDLPKESLTGSFTTEPIEDPHGLSYIHLASIIMTWESDVERERLGSLETGASSIDHGSWVELGHVQIGVDLGPMNKSIRETRLTIIGLTLFTIILALVVTAWFLGMIIKPIKSLAIVTEEISQGHLATRIEIGRRDEIGQLATSFERMVDSLIKSRREVENYQATLEDKIRERTCELEDAQNQLVQSEKMGAIGQLAAGVAHELNNPLAGILGYSQFALEKLSNRTAETITEKDIASFNRYLGDIENQARRCKTIVQNLLKFSRSSQDSDATEFDLGAALIETVELLRHQLEMQQIQVVTKITASSPEIRGNAGKIQQVVTNLIINAMHATPQGGTITIGLRHSPTLGEFDGAVEIFVSDTGEGIPNEIIGKIFEPFFTTKAVGKGTGLGLSVSYGIIQDHGGEIKVTSEIGAGTTFVIILPLQSKQDSADIPQE